VIQQIGGYPATGQGQPGVHKQTGLKGSLKAREKGFNPRVCCFAASTPPPPPTPLHCCCS